MPNLKDPLGDKEQAAENYRLVVGIEDAYREQFRRMYPGRKMVSRVGEKSYQFAKKRLGEMESDSK